MKNAMKVRLEMRINFNGFDFGFGMEGADETCEIIVTLGNQDVEKVNVPKIFAKQQYAQLVQQVSRDTRPFKISCIIKDYTEQGKTLDNSLVFENKAYINAFGKDDKS